MEVVLPIGLNEQDLLAACARQERWAQKILYEEFHRPMMGVCLRYSNHEEDARDILHEGFIKVFKHIGKFEPGTSLPAWMRRIMVNTAIDYYRKVIRRRTEDIEEAVRLQSDDVDAVSQMSEAEILQAVQKLSFAYRAVFNLYVIEGYSHKEIADILNISESTSRSNLVKARTRLKEMIREGLDRHEGQGI